MRLGSPVALVLALLAAPGCGDSERLEPTGTTYRDAAAGFSVTYPPGWERAPTSLTPGLLDPLELVSLGTGALEPTGAHLPGGALRAVGPTDGFVSIQERAGEPTPEFTQRAKPFELGPPTHTEVSASVPEGATFREWFVPFRDGPRGFYAIVAIGRAAPPERRAEVVGILDSLVFEGLGRSREPGTD